ncbi:AzlC family ABC transporter permease [soil metagenome]
MTPVTRSIEPIRALVRHPEFRNGLSDTLAINVGVGAWGLVTGVAMVQTGLPIPLALAMTFLVYAGSAQLAALPLIASGAPIWLILATAACVNLRFVVFSAHWRPYLMRYSRARRIFMGYFAGDVVYVHFTSRFKDPSTSEGQREYFWGIASINWLGWQVPCIAGVFLADVIPAHWGLAFAGVLALLGLLYSLINDGTSAVAAAVAGIAAIAAFALPLRLHLVVAIATGVVVGLLLERGGIGTRRQAPGEGAGDVSGAAASPEATSDAVREAASRRDPR